MLDQPILSAGASVLRPFTMDDLELVREASSDPLITPITTVPSPFSDDAGRAFVERQWSRAATGQGWSWAIARRDDGRSIGQVGLWPVDSGRATIGYWVVESARGAGAAAHAVRAVSRFAFDRVGVERLELRIEPGNTASRRTASACGFIFEGMVRSAIAFDHEPRDLEVHVHLLADEHEERPPSG